MKGEQWDFCKTLLQPSDVLHLISFNCFSSPKGFWDVISCLKWEGKKRGGGGLCLRMTVKRWVTWKECEMLWPLEERLLSYEGQKILLYLIAPGKKKERNWLCYSQGPGLERLEGEHTWGVKTMRSDPGQVFSNSTLISPRQKRLSSLRLLTALGRTRWRKWRVASFP